MARSTYTDPPYGLLKQDDDPAKELKFNGVFRYANGKLQAIIKDLPRPNGIAFSPDEKILYISNSEEKHRFWMRYNVYADGTVSNGKVFADATADPEAGLPDGMKVGFAGQCVRQRTSAVCGCFLPMAGISGLSSRASHRRTARGRRMAVTLYITATTGVYRVKLAVAGEKPLYQ